MNQIGSTFPWIFGEVVPTGTTQGYSHMVCLPFQFYKLYKNAYYKNWKNIKNLEWKCHLGWVNKKSSTLKVKFKMK